MTQGIQTLPHGNEQNAHLDEGDQIREEVRLREETRVDEKLQVHEAIRQEANAALGR